MKVLIDGQGADEILAGYHKYAPWYLQELINHYHFIAAGKELDLLKKNNFTFPWGIKNWVAAFFPSHVSIALEKKEYNKSIHHSQITQDFMSCTKGHEWEGIHKTVVTNLNDILHFNVMENGLEELLRFSDRNAMSQGCEVRLPFLQHDLVSFIFSLPSKYKIQNGFTKSILRNLMSNRLPSEIIWRKDKVAYEPPQKKWMETQVMKDYIFEAKRLLVNENILKPHVMEAPHKILHSHDADNYDWRYLCVAKLLSK